MTFLDALERVWPAFAAFIGGVGAIVFGIVKYAFNKAEEGIKKRDSADDERDIKIKSLEEKILKIESLPKCTQEKHKSVEDRSLKNSYRLDTMENRMTHIEKSSAAKWDRLTEIIGSFERRMNEMQISIIEKIAEIGGYQNVKRTD